MLNNFSLLLYKKFCLYFPFRPHWINLTVNHLSSYFTILNLPHYLEPPSLSEMFTYHSKLFKLEIIFALMHINKGDYRFILCEVCSSCFPIVITHVLNSECKKKSQIIGMYVCSYSPAFPPLLPPVFSSLHYILSFFINDILDIHDKLDYLKMKNI